MFFRSCCFPAHGRKRRGRREAVDRAELEVLDPGVDDGAAQAVAARECRPCKLHWIEAGRCVESQARYRTNHSIPSNMGIPRPLGDGGPFAMPFAMLHRHQGLGNKSKKSRSDKSDNRGNFGYPKSTQSEINSFVPHFVPRNFQKRSQPWLMMRRCAVSGC